MKNAAIGTYANYSIQYQKAHFCIFIIELNLLLPLRRDKLNINKAETSMIIICSFGKIPFSFCVLK